MRNFIRFSIMSLLLGCLFQASSQSCISLCDSSYGVDLRDLQGQKTICMIQAGNWYNECLYQAQDLYRNCQSWESSGSGIYLTCMSFYYDFRNSCETGFNQRTAECSIYDFGIWVLQDLLDQCIACCNNPACSGQQGSYENRFRRIPGLNPYVNFQEDAPYASIYRINIAFNEIQPKESLCAF